MPAFSPSPAVHRSRALRAEAGFSLPEVLVSAIVMVLIAVGTLTTLSATGRAGSEERNRTQAHAIALDDQARLRTMQVSGLGVLNETGTVVEGGRTYTVESKGQFATDPGSTESCAEDTSYSDYIEISSTVTWASIGSRPPVVLESIVAPPSGSLAENRGSLAISVVDASGTGIEGITVNGTGPESFSGVTGVNGCVVFTSLLEGTYTVEAAASGMIDKDGDPPGPETTTVVGRSTNTLVLQYDTPGAVEVLKFETRATAGGPLTDSSADSLVVYNTAMAVPAVYGTPGTFAASLTATPVFPFPSPVSVYPGTCVDNMPPALDPELSPPRIASATVTPGSTAAVASIQMPAVHITVWSGRRSNMPGTPVPGARVRIIDTNCLTERTFTAGTAGPAVGTLNHGLPWGVYDICAESEDGTREVTVTDQEVQDYTDGLTLHLYTLGGRMGTCA